MNLENIHKQVITFVAACVLFMGSFAYVVSVAFKDRDTLAEKRNVAATQEYIDAIE